MKVKLYKNDEILEISSFDISKKNLCECTDNYGLKIGCTDAGCYSRNNCQSSFFEDMAKEFDKVFGKDINTFEDQDWFYHNADEYLKSLPSEQREWCKNWIKKNEWHVEATHYNGYIVECDDEKFLDAEIIEE